jgi:putative ABC transport system permease protein
MMRHARWWSRRRQSRQPVADVREELAFHLEMRTRELMAGGLDRETAAAQARQKLGDTTLEPDLLRLAASRDRVLRRWASLDEMRFDLRDAARRLSRSPAFTVATVGIIALGFGATSAVFSLANTAYFRPLPFREDGRLVRVQEYRLTSDGAVSWIDASAPTLQAMKDSGDFSASAALRPLSLALFAGDSGARVEVGAVTDGWSAALGISPVLGRLFTREEEQAGDAADAVVISHHLWQAVFAGRADALGQRLRFDGGSRAVVGVLPVGYSFPYLEDAWWPTRVAIDQRGFFLWGRLRPGVTIADANRHFDEVAPALFHDHPDTMRGLQPRARSMRDVVIGDQGRVVMLLGWSVAVLLLIVGTNIAMLLMTQLASRQRELAVRAALGCGVVRQGRTLTLESLFVALAGGAVGLIATLLLHGGLARLLPAVLTTQFGEGAQPIDWRVLTFALGLALVGGLVLGAVGAFRASSVNLAAAFRESTRTGFASGRRVLSALVVLELTLASALVGVAITVGAEFIHLESRDVGFPTSNLWTFHVELQSPRLSTAAARHTLIDQLQTRLRGVPGTSAVGISTVNPLCCGDWGASFAIDGQPVTSANANKTNWRLVTPPFFETLGVRLRAGRFFDDHDTTESEPVAIVDERFARRYWPGRSAIGQRVKRGWTDSTYPWMRIVGVVSAVDDEGDYSDTWYAPYFQNPVGPSSDELHVWMRVAREPAPVSLVRAVMRDIDRALPIYRLSAMNDIKREELEQRRLGTGVAVSFAAVGTVLALCGVYALVAFVVTREQRDMGIRLALGATPGHVLRQVVGRMLRLSMVGVGVGVLVIRLTQHQLAAALGAAPEPFWPIAAAVAIGLLLAVVSAAGVPARAVLRIDPRKTLAGS